MTELVNKHIIKVQIGVAIVFVVSVVTLIYRFSGYAYASENHETRITKIESKFDNLATKEDLKIFKEDIKDYINKK